MTTRKAWFNHYAIPLDSQGKTSKEIIEEMSLNWKITKLPVYTKKDGKEIDIEGKFAVTKEDDGKPLGIVGNVYKPLQNNEAFPFFDAIVGSKEAHYVSAGSLDNDKKVFMVAKLNGDIKTTHDDVMEKYLILNNSHDGSSAVTIQLMALRLICTNGMIGFQSKGVHKVRHTLSMGMGINKVRESLGILNSQFDYIGELSRKMVQTEFKESMLENYLEKIGMIPASKDGERSTRANNIIEQVRYNYNHGIGATPGNLWGAFNAVTEYYDWKTKQTPSQLKSNLFGHGANVKQTALAYAKTI